MTDDPRQDRPLDWPLEVSEILSGCGQVERADGTVIGLRDYYLIVWMTAATDSGGDTQTQTIDGELQLELDEFPQLAGQTLELTTEDGRRLGFFVAGPNAAIAALGELKRRSGA